MFACPSHGSRPERGAAASPLARCARFARDDNGRLGRGTVIAVAGLILVLLLVGVFLVVRPNSPPPPASTVAPSPQPGRLSVGYETGVRPQWMVPAPWELTTVVGVDPASGTVLVSSAGQFVALDLATGEQRWSTTVTGPAQGTFHEGLAGCLAEPWHNTWVCDGGVTLDTESGSKNSLPVPGSIDEDASLGLIGEFDGTVVYTSAVAHSVSSQLVAFSDPDTLAWEATVDGSYSGHTQDRVYLASGQAQGVLVDPATGLSEPTTRKLGVITPLRDGLLVSTDQDVRALRPDFTEVSRTPLSQTCVTVTPDAAVQLGTRELAGVYELGCELARGPERIEVVGRTERALILLGYDRERLWLVPLPTATRSSAATRTQTSTAPTPLTKDATAGEATGFPTDPASGGPPSTTTATADPPWDVSATSARIGQDRLVVVQGATVTLLAPD